MTLSPSTCVGKVATPMRAAMLEQRVLRGPDPLAADLDDLAVADVVVEDSPAHAVARLEDDAVDPALRQVERGGKPRESRADDRDLGGSCR